MFYCVSALGGSEDAVERDESSVNEVEGIKTHEQRAVNYLVYEFLLKYGYKLTANTLADQNEDQVGNNVH